ncbi:MAG TPA: hypothetical protein VEJ46_04800 [Candidatus Acidoferrum sp.]|nr:hypothetical protein [Candidatus Acidoferrum sp.]
MRASRLLPLVLIVCVVCSSASAQQTASTSSPPATSDPQAVALVQRALVALTGGATVSDVTLTGTARRIAGSDDETGTATLTATAASDSKVSLNFPSGQRTEIRNHSAVPLPGALPPGVPASVLQAVQPVGAWSGPDAAMHGMAGHNIMTDPSWFFPALTLGNLLSSQAYVLSYVGPEALNGQAVVHVSATQQFPLLSNADPQSASLLQHLSQMNIYLDPTTSLPVALAFNAHPDANALVDIPTEIQFSSYQAVGGVLAPFHVQKQVNHSLVLDLQFNNATFDSGLTAVSFQLQ